MTSEEMKGDKSNALSARGGLKCLEVLFEVLSRTLTYADNVKCYCAASRAKERSSL